MMQKALRFGLRANAVRHTSLAANRLDDWENFKMPNAPYADMGPLPPAPASADVKGNIRLGYLPEGYFKALEPKLGYTGGYTLFWGGLLTALSKEWLVLGPEMWWAASAAVFYAYVFRDYAAPFADREELVHHDLREARVGAWRDYKIGLAESEIDGIARLKEQTQGLAMIQEQRKVNIQMALDAEHMNRQADLAEAVKKRLDYQVAVNNAERDAMSKHMIKWIEAEVAKAIEKRSSKDDLAAAINQLKGMAGAKA